MYESEGAVAGPERGWVDHQEMVVSMDETRLTTIAQIEQFLAASAVVQFTPSQDDEEPGDLRDGRGAAVTGRRRCINPGAHDALAFAPKTAPVPTSTASANGRDANPVYRSN
ncbi:hypothetical protein D8B23_13345 [Verminephrobacter aporrectodeae subsp. tuberculatae]|nr:hypothetical protein [Verminephrobacter aporrectodeae subsp. tuberculatae]